METTAGGGGGNNNADRVSVLIGILTIPLTGISFQCLETGK